MVCRYFVFFHISNLFNKPGGEIVYLQVSLRNRTTVGGNILLILFNFVAALWKHEYLRLQGKFTMTQA